jgi:hypothetical protein
MQAVQVAKAWKLSIEPWTRVPVSQFRRAIFFQHLARAFNCWRQNFPLFNPCGLSPAGYISSRIYLYQLLSFPSCYVKTIEVFGSWEVQPRSKQQSSIDSVSRQKSFDITQQNLFMFNLFPPLHRLCWSFWVRVVKKSQLLPQGRVNSRHEKKKTKKCVHARTSSYIVI